MKIDVTGPLLGLLRENKLFVGISDAVMAECAKQFTLIKACRRQPLYCQGDPCNHVYCLLRGSVRVARLAEDGSEFTTRIAARADLFGEEALFDDRSFSSTATSLSDGFVAVCSAARMRALISRYPALSINIAQFLREDQNRTLRRLEQVSFKRVRERLLSLLYELAAHCGEGKAGRYEIKLTHGELASLIGSSRETVSLELSKLARTGVISRRGRAIIVTPIANAAA